MRLTARLRHVEDEEESAFVSMTDMTVSFLFIVMILLAFFASQLQAKDTVPLVDFQRVTDERDLARNDLKKREKELEAARIEINDLKDQISRQSLEIASLTEERDAARQRLMQRDEDLAAARLRIEELEREVANQELRIDQLNDRIRLLEEQLKRLNIADPLEVYFDAVNAERRKILESLRDSLHRDFPGLQVEISSQMDALRFKGDGLFASGSSNLAPDKRRVVEAIATKLADLLPCYTLGPDSIFSEDCNRADAVIEAVQIEGHTDSDADERTNLTLSTGRAAQTFFAMIERVPGLVHFLNSLNQPVLSVAGYGEMRPVASNSTTQGKATNRRIDLRIIMFTPQSEEDIQKIKRELRSRVAGVVGQ